MLGEPKGITHVSTLFNHQVLRGGPAAQPVKSFVSLPLLLPVP